MERIRVASLQYFIRPVQTFEQFRDQVEALIETAADIEWMNHQVARPEDYAGRNPRFLRPWEPFHP